MNGILDVGCPDFVLKRPERVVFIQNSSFIIQVKSLRFKGKAYD